jgi:hypothetical protein
MIDSYPKKYYDGFFSGPQLASKFPQKKLDSIMFLWWSLWNDWN